MVKIYLISSIVIFLFLVITYISYLRNLHKYIKILSYGDMSDVVNYHSHDGHHYSIRVLRVGVWGLHWEIEPTVYHKFHDIELMYDYRNKLYEIIKNDYVK